jgi:hypothetical protein
MVVVDVAVDVQALFIKYRGTVIGGGSHQHKQRQLSSYVVHIHNKSCDTPNTYNSNLLSS